MPENGGRIIQYNTIVQVYSCCVNFIKSPGDRTYTLLVRVLCSAFESMDIEDGVNKFPSLSCVQKVKIFGRCVPLFIS